MSYLEIASETYLSTMWQNLEMTSYFNHLSLEVNSLKMRGIMGLCSRLSRLKLPLR